MSLQGLCMYQITWYLEEMCFIQGDVPYTNCRDLTGAIEAAVVNYLAQGTIGVLYLGLIPVN